ncbi:MAG: 2-oxoglutarate dehydrogenase complex dihydrolipoyllysine-residue succinyltransferase, partial [Rhodospirillales bacterium]|nr:2-oxoglutarate dehydrogenase complex dihydrolipoyllysine-residue succinyltransferase [Rhodospirillales bacterium]
MTQQIVVPALGESVTEATVAKWFKAPGDAIAVDEPLVELETDKVSVEVNAKSAGVLSEIIHEAGAEVDVGAVLGSIEEGGAPAKKAAPEPKEEPKAEKAPEPAPAPAPAPKAASANADMGLSPAVRKLVDDNGLDPATIPATGKDGRLTKGDVLAAMDGSAEPVPAPAPAPSGEAVASVAASAGPREERVKMTRLRKRIAERLKEAQNTAAMLTTFNEADMSVIMKTRSQVQDSFTKKHGVKLGFMSFFVKACVVALKEIPEVNAQIDGDEIVYKNHYDIGVAVGTEQGLMVPVLRDADLKSFGEIEAEIIDLAVRARGGKLGMDDLTGGTFTITNGGIYGSLLSTPILNPPQSGILGMHSIVKRPIAINDEVVIRPMMN